MGYGSLTLPWSGPVQVLKNGTSFINYVDTRVDLMARGRKQPKTLLGGVSLKDAMKMVGQTRYIAWDQANNHGCCGYGEDDDVSDADGCYVQVEVTGMEVVGCKLMATYRPYAGIGQKNCCLSSLLTEEQIKELETVGQVNALVSEEVRELLSDSYIRRRRAKFITFLEKELSEEERQCIQDEWSNKLYSDNFMKSTANRIVKKRRYAEAGIDLPEEN